MKLLREYGRPEIQMDGEAEKLQLSVPLNALRRRVLKRKVWRTCLTLDALSVL